ncbi:hypothetical protein JCM19233_424 [Vibrio astriarenae]|nr:hypothetical protein JCM19233_424 [Vibrio sp. C7]
MFKKIDEASAKPVVWSAYTADVLWTDSHIAKQMLAFHLNPDLSLASRTAEFINASVDWLISEFNLSTESKTIDFGCGPGLYTQRLKPMALELLLAWTFPKTLLSMRESRLGAQSLISNITMEITLSTAMIASLI